jgi:hypothetical protein
MQCDIGNGKYEIIMPLHVRSIAVSISVICFFVLSFVGWICGLSAYVCCKRALAGAVLAYIAGALSVKAINAILVNAMISSQVDRQQDGSGSGANPRMRFEGKGSGGTN